MKMRLSLMISVAAALALGACTTSPPSPRQLMPLPGYPAAPVASQALPPPMIAAPQQTMAPAGPVAGEVAPGQIASASPAMPAPDATAPDLRKTDLIGGWTLASSGESCQLSMNLTSWTGGYRASTRGCASDELKSIGAWDLDGKTVLLKDANGSVVARLMASGGKRFSGQTDASKRGVQFFRS